MKPALVLPPQAENVPREDMAWWESLPEVELRKLARHLFAQLALVSMRQMGLGQLRVAVLSSLKQLGDVPDHQARFVCQASRGLLLKMAPDLAEKSAWRIDQAMPLGAVPAAVRSLLARMTPTQRLELARSQRDESLVVLH